MWQFAILALIFLFAFFLFMWIWAGINRKRVRVENRLLGGRSDPMLSSDPMAPSTPELVLGDQMTPALAGTVPMGPEDRGALQQELREAGYYRPTALMEYAALRAIFIIFPLVLAAILMQFTEDTTQVVWIWIGAGILAILGFSLPRVYLYVKAKARQRQIERGLPTAIDMLTLCLSAGLNVLNSLERVTAELRFAYPVLGEEFQIVRRQAELRSLEFALIQFGERTGMPQIRNLSVLLTQSENLGTDAVSVLREYADDLRINMRQRADEMANKAPFKLLFPAWCLALGAAILLIAPAILTFMDFRHTNLINADIEQGRYFLENKDKIFQEYNSGSSASSEDPDYNFPKEWYKRRGNRPSKAEQAQKLLEGRMYDEPEQKKKRSALPSFMPKKQEEKK
jgi:tight adherence protein C